jgi:hypothetical protein
MSASPSTWHPVPTGTEIGTTELTELTPGVNCENVAFRAMNFELAAFPLLGIEFGDPRFHQLSPCHYIEGSDWRTSQNSLISPYFSLVT